MSDYFTLHVDDDVDGDYHVDVVDDDDDDVDVDDDDVVDEEQLNNH